MSKPSIKKRKKDLDNYFIITKNEMDADKKNLLTQYLLILIIGYFQKSIIEIINDYSSNNAAGNVINYVYNRLDKTHRNFDSAEIKNILKIYNTAWENQFNFKIDQVTIEILNSLVRSRNDVAHGKIITISLDELERNYRAIWNVIYNVEQICK